MTSSNEVEEAAEGIQALVSGGKTADQACRMLVNFGTSAEVVSFARSLYEERVGIISHLKLLRPVYLETAHDGHFGRKGRGFTWEKTDMVKPLKKAMGR